MNPFLRLARVALALLACAPALLSAAAVGWKSALSQPAEWYATPEAATLAASVLRYQMPSGGWPKNTDLARPPSGQFLADRRAGKDDATIDNNGTTLPLRFLARVIAATAPAAENVTAFERGFDYLLDSQYPNGGWPQFFPLREGYYTHITYNDNAMVNALVLLREASAGRPPFAFVDSARRARAAVAVTRGIDCILSTQVVQNGARTAWCAQHDSVTLKPAWARAFEPPSLSGSESVGVTRFLMAIENPSPAVIAAVEGAVAWFEKVKITGLRFENFTDAASLPDRRVVLDPSAGPLWARFYELETDRPLFLGRDRQFHYDHAEIERERRVGYVYYGPWAAELLAETHPRWRATLPAAALAAAAALPLPATAPEGPTIHLIGDSTMADKPKLTHPERGWGQLFRELVLPPARVANHAKNGRSTKSFLDEGLWNGALGELRAGDWVIIQFGHNDAKVDSPERYAAPQGAYRDNLLRFVTDTRARNAHPVLATSVARRKWNDDGQLVPTHGDYPAVVRALAAEQNVPLLELETLTTELERSLGEEGSKKLHLWFPAGTVPGVAKELKDDTHYSEFGARSVAALAAAEIRRLGLPLAALLKPAPDSAPPSPNSSLPAPSSSLLAPGSSPADATVAADGTGDYTSLQEAISKAPMRTGANDPRWVIQVKPGTYRERIYVQRERGRILVRGADAATTTITFDLHANLPGPDGKPLGTFYTPTVQIDGDGMVWEDLTLANTAGPVGQALALRADGDRLVFRRCRFLGWQDTILLNRGRHYFEDCYVEGHVDFIFGAATAFFSRCHIHCLRDGYITAASTPEGAPHGFVFADGRVTTGPEVVKGVYLGRPWRDFAKTVFLRTELAGKILAEGWHNWNKPAAEKTTFYAEFASTGPGASPATRAPWAHTPTAAEAAVFTPEIVLAGADDWNPLAP
jgi:pectinesterase